MCIWLVSPVFGIGGLLPSETAKLAPTYPAVCMVHFESFEYIKNIAAYTHIQGTAIAIPAAVSLAGVVVNLAGVVVSLAGVVVHRLVADPVVGDKAVRSVFLSCVAVGGFLRRGPLLER